MVATAKDDSFAGKLGKAIQFYRERAELTQEELAHGANISRQALINYEGGRRTPSIEICWKIARVLGLSRDRLIDYEPESEKEKLVNFLESYGYRLQFLERDGSTTVELLSTESVEGFPFRMSDSKDRSTKLYAPPVQSYYLPYERVVEIVSLLQSKGNHVERRQLDNAFRLLQEESLYPAMMELDKDPKYKELRAKFTSLNPNFFDVCEYLEERYHPFDLSTVPKK